MKTITLVLVSLLVSIAASAKNFTLPQGKGKCPHFSFVGEDSWVLKSARAKGDRWTLTDTKTKSLIARFDYKLSNTDQKQLPEVEDTELTLGSSKVQKYTVTTSFPNDGEKATEGLITSYTYIKGPLEGLVVMSEKYDTSSGTDKKIEKALSSINIVESSH